MSQENVEVVRKSVDAVNRGDIEEVLAFTDADAEASLGDHRGRGRQRLPRPRRFPQVVRRVDSGL
jgi:ketosteroid isomerase-like protein